MFTYRHLVGWLFVFGLLFCFGAASASADVVPAKTAIHDIVYAANGTPSAGGVLISWPAFTTADGAAVAASSLSLTLGPGGMLDVALVPNAGAVPAGTYYTVVFHLDNGKTSTEYWTVPSGTTVAIRDIRAKVVPQSVAFQPITHDVLMLTVKPLAQDAAVVHRSGNEDVAGAKTFTTSPVVPAPQSDSEVANKRYVDDAVHNLNPAALGLIAAAPSTDQTIAQPTGTALKVNRLSATNMNGVRFADQFSNLQAAINDAGTNGAVTIPATYTGTDTYSNPNGIVVQDLRGKPDRQKGFINAVTDCGVPTDRTSDSCSAMTACIATHPGKRIALPKLGASNVGGGSATNQDYYSSCRWDLNGNGMVLSGMNTGGRWSGAVKVKFASGIGGVRIPWNCYGCGIEDLELTGSDLWNYTDLKTWEDWNTSTLFSLDGPDGVQFLGGEPWAKNVKVEGFKRHGFHVAGNGYSGQTPAQPDIAHFQGLYANGNRGYGIVTNGADANVGLHEGFNAIQNALGGIYDGSNYGNTFSSAHTSLNAPNGIVAGANKTVASTSVASNVKTITASAATGWTAGQWVTDTGSADTTFNGTCKLLTVSGATATCNFTHADGSTTGGTAATSSALQMYAYYTAASIKTGSFVSTTYSLFLNPYAEANQTGTNLGTNSLSIGSPLMEKNTGNWIFPASAGITYHKTKFMIFWPLDVGGFFIVRNPANDTNMFTVDPSGNVVALGKTTTAGAKINTQVDPNGTGLAHKRVSTGSIAASSSAAITVTWGAAFANTNYTVNCSVQEATASTSTLRVHHVESVTTTTVIVRVVNDDTGAAHSGNLHCMAMHD